MKTQKTAATVQITAAMLKDLPKMGRRALKALCLALTGSEPFGLKEDILEKTHEAVCDYLGIDA